MKKSVIILICIAAVILFALLVNYGATHVRGVPVKIVEQKAEVLEVPFFDKDIDLNKGIATDFWSGLKPQEIKLIYQLMALPWPKSSTPMVKVTAFHNTKDIYFYMEWIDETEDKILGVNKFSDACAIMFPMDEKAQAPTLMMGFLGRADIWHWKASRDIQFWLKEEPVNNKVYVDLYYPFEDKETLVVSKEIVKSAVNDLTAIRVGTVTPKENQYVEGRGFYNQGVWQVVFKRSLKAVDAQNDAIFNSGKRLCAFAVWNGSKGERGGRKSISDWVELLIK
ncbi:MAG: ethylbenzene dehydrogenase-related protein [Candidatus Omnitrophota bacterium]